MRVHFKFLNLFNPFWLDLLRFIFTTPNYPLIHESLHTANPCAIIGISYSLDSTICHR